MPIDITEAPRREMQADINTQAKQVAESLGNDTAAYRALLEQQHGQVWDTDELCNDFTVLGFGAPFVVVVRKADGVKGSCTFSHSPRFYYDFEPHRK